MDGSMGIALLLIFFLGFCLAATFAVLGFAWRNQRKLLWPIIAVVIGTLGLLVLGLRGMPPWMMAVEALVWFALGWFAKPAKKAA